MDVFLIDDMAFPNIHVSSLKREFIVVDGEGTGRTVEDSMIRDIKGTHYNFTLELFCGKMGQREYSKFYNLISSPVDAHKIQMPYNQETMTFDAYITSGEDSLVSMSDKGNVWKGITCKFIAMEPQRRPRR